MKTKDFVILAIAVLVLLPVVLVFNENMSAWYINVSGLVYIALLAKIAKTNIGKLFIQRLEKIEDKLFGKVEG